MLYNELVNFFLTVTKKRVKYENTELLAKNRLNKIKSITLKET